MDVLLRILACILVEALSHVLDRDLRRVLVEALTNGAEVAARGLNVVDVLSRIGEGLTWLHDVVLVRVWVADSQVDRIGESPSCYHGISLTVLW